MGVGVSGPVNIVKGLGFRVFQSAAVPTRASGGGSGRLGAADPTPATQTAAFFGFRAVYPPRPPYQGGLHLELAGVGRVDCCCCLSVHFPGSTGSGTICFTHTVFKTPSSPIPDPSSFIWQNGEGQARKARPPAGARALAGATAGATLAGATLAGATLARATLEGARRGFFEFFCIKNTFLFLSLHIYMSTLAGATLARPWRLLMGNPGN